MTFLTSRESEFSTELSRQSYGNPFQPSRQRQTNSSRNRPASDSTATRRRNAEGQISNELPPLLEKMRAAFARGERLSDAERDLYEDLVLYYLYDKFSGRLTELLVESSPDGNHTFCKRAWEQFLADFVYFAKTTGQAANFRMLRDPEHLWACLFQIRRLLNCLHHWLVGESRAIVRLRASIWQSVFTRDLRRYIRSVYQSMGSIPTLITGPSGTGKELVARTLAMSRYIPFDSAQGAFVADHSQTWLATRLTAMAPTQIESELFGHDEGAFAGATGIRKGLFENCHRYGTVFLDEIGELDAGIQVKLLRALQHRTFQRPGGNEPCFFHGKVIAATSRNLTSQLESGCFRNDLYYRLCSDVIRTPSLHEQITDHPEDLAKLVNHLARRLCADDHEELTCEVVGWIETHLGRNYPWPGNVRELEQCLRNIMIRGSYRPANCRDSGPREEIGSRFLSCSLTAEELLVNYCTMVYLQTGSYEASARRLKIDRRTVKSKLDAKLLEKLSMPDEQ